MRLRSLRRVLFASLVACSLLGASAIASAAVPQTLTHQGRLYDAADKPINATLDVVFSIYAAAGDTTPIWTETSSITFEDGYFSVSLGEVTPLGATVFDGSVRHLGIKVGSDTEMSPRAVVQSVPYALLAGDVTGDIHPSSVTIGGTTVIDATGKWVGATAGLQGATGPTGPSGADGATGAAGAMGAAGLAGATGPQGNVGPQGPQGNVGAAGAQGPQGNVGATGPQGNAGAAGGQGPQGNVGATGPQGNAGAAGAQGPQGNVGAQGPQGNVGATGPQGNVGAAGAQGNVGATGPQGNVGPQGPAGPQGTMGPAGATGATGPAGAAQTLLFEGQATSASVGPVDYVFLNLQGVTLSAPLQRLTGTVTLAVSPGQPAIAIQVRLCFSQFPGGPKPFMMGNSFPIPILSTAEGNYITATESVLLGPGTYNVGLCAKSASAFFLSQAFATGWIQVY